MGKRSITTVYFRIKMRLPPGVKIPDAQAFIREALESYKKAQNLQTPIAALETKEVFIALEKREVVYL